MNANIHQIATGRVPTISERLPAEVVERATLHARFIAAPLSASEEHVERIRDMLLDWYERGQVDEWVRERRDERDSPEPREYMAADDPRAPF